jgi:hypothetical protein
MQRKHLALAALGAVWLATVASGMAFILDYASAPGAPAKPPDGWPASRLARAPGRATLVMLAHPHCPCTRASIGELALLMAPLQGQVTAHVLFLRPDGAPDGWERTDLWESAAAIPGVTVTTDPDGTEAAGFGALTSGQVVLYGASGGLLFSGGITPARGHAGDNGGRAAIHRLVSGRQGAASASPVFGCSLVPPTS